MGCARFLYTETAEPVKTVLVSKTKVRSFRDNYSRKDQIMTKASFLRGRKSVFMGIITIKYQK
jgi:hypothetical protein